MKAALLAFGLICLAFAAALILHVILVSADSGQSFGDTARNMLKTFSTEPKARKASLFRLGPSSLKS